MTREQARGVSEALMVKWRARHLDAKAAQAQTSQPGAPQSTAQQGQSGTPAPAAPIQGGVYEGLTPREQKIADIETAKFIEVGKEIFHNSEDLWGTIGVKRYGDKALEESAARAGELAAQDDQNGSAIWRRVTDTVRQLAKQTPSGPLH